jgi:hypothetical protein
LTQTVEDKDSDTSTESVNLSGTNAKAAFSIRDDGPSASTTVPDIASGEAHPTDLILDESTNYADGVSSVTKDFSVYFVSEDAATSAYEVNYGADGPNNSGAVTYGLSLTTIVNGERVAIGGSDVVFSGLTTLDSTAINLYVVNGEIVGRTSTGSDIYFKISVDNDGEVTFSRTAASPAIKHGSVSSVDENALITLNSGGTSNFAVTLTQTVTDGDGDTANARINLIGDGAVSGGPDFIIQDDGPTASTRTPSGASGDVAPATLVLDESISGDGVNTATGDFSVYFVTEDTSTAGYEIAYGTDGPATTDAVTYSLSLTTISSNVRVPASGTDVISSGLTTLDGTAINLYSENNDIVGKTASSASDVFFKLSVSSAGVVTFSRTANSPAIKHANTGNDDENATLALNGGNSGTSFAVTLTQTVKDGDGDSASASINLLGSDLVGNGPSFVIQDDGPISTTRTPTGSSGDVAPSDLVLDESPTARDGVNSAAADFSVYFVTEDSSTIGYEVD